MSGQGEGWDRDLDERASPSPLLQTWGWGEVQSRAGWTIQRVRLAGGAIASVQLRGVGPVREAYVPRGPVPATSEAVGALVEWASANRIARLTIEPEAPAAFGDVMRERGFSAATPVQPQHTRILKLAPPAEMLATFKHGRLYNIRTGEKRGVVIEQGKDAAVLERQSEALAAVLVARHAGRAYHLFAGRTGAHPGLMGNDLAWWAAIKAAAEDGCRDYDLWGVPPPGAGPDHPWHGLGFFKAEFGGEEMAYAGAWRLELSKAGSRLISLEKKARGHIRRLKRNIS